MLKFGALLKHFMSPLQYFVKNEKKALINTPCESAQKYCIEGVAQVNFMTTNTPYTIMSAQLL